MDELYIAVIAGTTREGRKSIHAAKLVQEIGSAQPGVKAVLVDPKDFNFTGEGDSDESKDPKYSEITKKADAFYIVTPEYNHSFPGTLKRMLDSELDNYRHKPVALAGVSSGDFGGVRAIHSLAPVTRRLGMINIFADVQFQHSKELFNENGELQDPAIKERIQRAWDELIWMTKVVKLGQQSLQDNQSE